MKPIVRAQLKIAGIAPCTMTPVMAIALDTVIFPPYSIEDLEFSSTEPALISLVPGGTPLVGD